MPATHSFPRKLRLSHAREFEAVYAARLRKPKGPLIVFARANQLEHHRLGLSIGRVVGGAVRRNRLKRHIREAFRLLQHELPRHAEGSFDIVVAARRHEELDLSQYMALITEAIAQLHKDHTKRAERQAANPAAASPERQGGGPAVAPKPKGPGSPRE